MNGPPDDDRMHGWLLLLILLAVWAWLGVVGAFAAAAWLADRLG